MGAQKAEVRLTCAQCPRSDLRGPIGKRMHEIRAHEKNWSTRRGGAAPRSGAA